MQLKSVLFLLSSSLIATVSSAPSGYYNGHASAMSAKFYINADNQNCQRGVHQDVDLTWGLAEERSADQSPTKAVGMSRALQPSERMDLYVNAGNNLCGKWVDFLDYHNNSRITKNCVDISKYGDAVSCIRLWKTAPLK